LPLGILFKLNRRRNILQADLTNKAIAHVERMSSQPMQGYKVGV
jgi:hypothetical protein